MKKDEIISKLRENPRAAKIVEETNELNSKKTALYERRRKELNDDEREDIDQEIKSINQRLLELHDEFKQIVNSLDNPENGKESGEENQKTESDKEDKEPELDQEDNENASEPDQEEPENGKKSEEGKNKPKSEIRVNLEEVNKEIDSLNTSLTGLNSTKANIKKQLAYEKDEKVKAEIKSDLNKINKEIKAKTEELEKNQSLKLKEEEKQRKEAKELAKQKQEARKAFEEISKIDKALVDLNKYKEDIVSRLNSEKDEKIKAEMENDLNKINDEISKKSAIKNKYIGAYSEFFAEFEKDNDNDNKDVDEEKKSQSDEPKKYPGTEPNPEVKKPAVLPPVGKLDKLSMVVASLFEKISNSRIAGFFGKIFGKVKSFIKGDKSNKPIDLGDKKGKSKTNWDDVIGKMNKAAKKMVEESQAKRSEFYGRYSDNNPWVDKESTTKINSMSQKSDTINKESGSTENEGNKGNEGPEL